MLHHMMRGLGVVAATAVVLSTGSGAAAATGLGQDHGQHVRMCAQVMGFDGVRNPGMHTGFAGWDPAHEC